MGLTPEDIKIAKGIRLKAKRLASSAKQNWYGRMDPRDLPWHKAAELTDVTESAAWTIGWLLSEVERLKTFEKFYDEMNQETQPTK